MEILQRIQQEQRSERCVVMTAYGSAENAVEALKAGAFDYLTKPVDLKQFRAVVASAVQAQAAPAAAARGRPTTARGKAGGGDRQPAAPAALERLVGDSEPMRLVKARIAKVARGMAPVLVRGESGTGKELVARAVHACSQRSDGPFVAVNCGAIPENLLEAEFFGARKGSYTGSAQDRDGYFQAARGGTLFLDEIGDLPLAMQSKLLRAIQERSVRPIGSTQEDAVDVRIVSATHKDLQAEVQAGRFRQDLFYRLNVIEIAGAGRCASAAKTCPRCARRCWRASRATPACRCPRCRPTVLQQLSRASAARQRARTGEPAAPRRRAERRRRCCISISSTARTAPADLRCAGASRAGTAPREPQPRRPTEAGAARCRATCRATSTSRSARSWCAPCRKAASTAPRPRRAWA